MLNKIRILTILAAFLMLGLMVYEAGFKDSSRKWKNFDEPQVASYASLDEDEKIIKELERQTRYGSYKDLDPAFFVKPNIFNTIEKR